jgi:flagellar biogenesis protein FliO
MSEPVWNIRSFLSGLTICLGLTASSAGQSTMPADNRYALPVQADAEPTGPAPAEPLIAYRRDDEPASDVMAPSPARPTMESSFSADESSNPLRAPAPAPAASEPAPTATTAEASKGAPVTVNPFANVAAAAPPIITPPPATPAIGEPIVRYDTAVAPAILNAKPQDAQNAKPEVTEPAVSSEPVFTTSTPSIDAAPAEPVAVISSAANAPNRRLAPKLAEPVSGSSSDASSHSSTRLPFNFSKLESFSTAGAGLAIVVGLFLVAMWLMRRGSPKGNGLLPAEAFAMLGRAPLTAQSFAHLVRIGNKLVLVAVSADGAQPLTEVTDPLEVDRLTGLCASGSGYGPSAEFQQVLAQLAKEPARGFLGAEASSSGRRRG